MDICMLWNRERNHFKNKSTQLLRLCFHNIAQGKCFEKDQCMKHIRKSNLFFSKSLHSLLR